MLSPTTRSIKFTTCTVLCVNIEKKHSENIQLEFIGWYYTSNEIIKQIEKQSLINSPLEVHHITNIRRVIKLYSMDAYKFLKLSNIERKKKQ